MDRGRTDFLGQRPCAITVDVHHDDGLWTVRGESPGECPTDAASGPGHDDDLAGQFHRKLIPRSDCRRKKILVENTCRVLSETCDTA